MASERLATLDGLRGYACLIVVASHAGHAGWVPPIMGVYGVMIFFALSGFLMAYHYLPGMPTWRYWAVFLMRRFFRVYPAFVFTTACLWATSSLFMSPLPHFNLLALYQHWLLQESIATLWTIPVEMRFYAVFPLIGIGFSIMPARFRSAFILALCGCFFFYTANTRLPVFSLTRYLPIFLGGVTAAYFYKKGALTIIPASYWNGFTIAYVAVIAAAEINSNLLTSHSANSVFRPLIMSMLVLSIVQSQGVIRQLFTNPIAHFFGRISYSLYLVHYFIFMVFSSRLLLPHDIYMNVSPTGGIAVFAGSVLLAWLIYVFIETPFNRLGKTLSKRIMMKKNDNNAI